jgi:hypothetical protein
MHQPLSLAPRLCLLGAFLVVGFAAFLTWLWPPTDPHSAAGDLAWVTPTVATVVAALWSALALVWVSPCFTALSESVRLLVVTPLVCAVFTGAAIYLRA